MDYESSHLGHDSSQMDLFPSNSGIFNAAGQGEWYSRPRGEAILNLTKSNPYEYGNFTKTCQEEVPLQVPKMPDIDVDYSERVADWSETSVMRRYFELRDKFGIIPFQPYHSEAQSEGGGQKMISDTSNTDTLSNTSDHIQDWSKVDQQEPPDRPSLGGSDSIQFEDVEFSAYSENSEIAYQYSDSTFPDQGISDQDYGDEPDEMRSDQQPQETTSTWQSEMVQTEASSQHKDTIDSEKPNIPTSYQSYSITEEYARDLERRLGRKLARRPNGSYFPAYDECPGPRHRLTQVPGLLVPRINVYSTATNTDWLSRACCENAGCRSAISLAEPKLGAIIEAEKSKKNLEYKINYDNKLQTRVHKPPPRRRDRRRKERKSS